MKIIVIYCESIDLECCYSSTTNLYLSLSINFKYKMPVCKQVNIYRKERLYRVKLKIALQFRKQTQVLII